MKVKKRTSSMKSVLKGSPTKSLKTGPPLKVTLNTKTGTRNVEVVCVEGEKKVSHGEGSANGEEQEKVEDGGTGQGKVIAEQVCESVLEEGSETVECDLEVGREVEVCEGNEEENGQDMAQGLGLSEDVSMQEGGEVEKQAVGVDDGRDNGHLSVEEGDTKEAFLERLQEALSSIQMRVFRYREDAILPTEPATLGSNGYDLRTPVSLKLKPRGTYVVRLGFTIVTNGLIGFSIRPRSSLSCTSIKVEHGTVDSDYRNEWFLTLRNTSQSQSVIVRKGCKVAQFVPELRFSLPITRLTFPPCHPLENLPTSELEKLVGLRSGALGSTNDILDFSDLQSLVGLATPERAHSVAGKCQCFLVDDETSVI